MGQKSSTEFQHALYRHPKLGRVARALDFALALAAGLSVAIVFSQAGVILHNKSSENLSIPSYVMWVLASFIVIAYGLLWTRWRVALLGVLHAAGSILATVAVVAYRPATTPGAFAPS